MELVIQGENGSYDTAIQISKKNKKISVTAAAQELKVSQPTHSNWESGRKAPSIESLIHMAKYYGITTDFLLGLTNNSDPRIDILQPAAPARLLALYETPVYVPERGWAFVDAVGRQLCFADGQILPFTDARNIYIFPPTYSFPDITGKRAMGKEAVLRRREVWVEPISQDTVLRRELRGWYLVRRRYEENEMGQRFYLDMYGSKGVAYEEMQNETEQIFWRCYGR